MWKKINPKNNESVERSIASVCKMQIDALLLNETNVKQRFARK